MLKQKEFESIKKEIDSYNEEREKIIQKAHKIIQTSKKIIYSLIKGDTQESQIKEIKAQVKDLKKTKGALEFPSIYKVALQEYVEAIAFYIFIKEKRLITLKETEVGIEEYLLGICDLTGELIRKAVKSVIDENYKEVYLIQEFIDLIYRQFLNFNFANGELRKKSDSIKWNLNKIENIIYELKLRKLGEKNGV